MKFPAAYYLLFLYASVIIRPFIMIGCDVYEHAFKEAIHMATVHAKYGSNHLETAVADTSKDNNKNSTASTSEDIATALVPAQQATAHPATCALSATYPKAENQKLISVFLSIQVPPPKV